MQELMQAPMRTAWYSQSIEHELEDKHDILKYIYLTIDQTNIPSRPMTASYLRASALGGTLLARAREYEAIRIIMARPYSLPRLLPLI